MHIETYVEMICVYRYIDITYHTSPLVWLIYVSFLCLLADGKQKKIRTSLLSRDFVRTNIALLHFPRIEGPH